MVSVKGFKQWLQMKDQEIQIQNLAIGMNSTIDITQDIHIIMLDYDIKDISKVIESVHELQSFWNLSDADIFRTKNGHHAIFWYDQIPYGRLKQIIEFAKYVDQMYKYISKYYLHKTIRVSGKYTYKDIVFVKKIVGKRVPSEEQITLGDMKRKEHKVLRDSNE